MDKSIHPTNLGIINRSEWKLVHSTAPFGLYCCKLKIFKKLSDETSLVTQPRPPKGAKSLMLQVGALVCDRGFYEVAIHAGSARKRTNHVAKKVLLSAPLNSDPELSFPVKHFSFPFAR
jgi:hypothetical protein